MLLEATGLTHAFEPEAPVLSGVELHLDPEVPTALIGPNGAGKTTLLHCLAGLLEATEGEVRLDGERLDSLARRAIARRISVVPQARPAAFAFSALEYTMMGRHAHSGRFALDGVTERELAMDALRSMAVEDLATRPMTQLSGGEAQRVIMARTIASGAPIWLLDEPTANLDVAHRIAVLQTVRQHCRDGGAALTVVHDLNLVEGWFDRVVVLAAGRIVADGSPDEVLTPQLFEEAFGIRMIRISDGDRRAWVADVDPDATSDVEEDVSDRGVSA